MPANVRPHDDNDGRWCVDEYTDRGVWMQTTPCASMREGILLYMRITTGKSAREVTAAAQAQTKTLLEKFKPRDLDLAPDLGKDSK